MPARGDEVTFGRAPPRGGAAWRTTTIRTLAAALLAVAPLALDAQAASPQEEALKKLAAEVPALVKAADADADGALGLAEFRTFQAALKKSADSILNALDPSIARKKAEKDLKKHDANADGKLDDAELKAQADAKRLKDIKDFGNGIRRPAVLETDSPLYKGYKSVMLYANIKPRKLPDEVFTLNYLPRAEELRK